VLKVVLLRLHRRLRMERLAPKQS